MPTRRSPHAHRDLRKHLEALYAGVHGPSLRRNDPVAFVHGYADPRDQEIMAVFAAGLAFGRVQLFWPALTQLRDWMDASGGPRKAIDRFRPDKAVDLHPMAYRWTKGTDLARLVAGLQRALPNGTPLHALFADGETTKDRLISAMARLRSATQDAASDQTPLPRGTTYLLTSPEGGSACKRWNLFLRWMVRPKTEGIDVGTWADTGWHTRDLIMPIDTHVGRIATLLRLLPRADNRWVTAERLTAALRVFDAEDPVRFDFAIAHLGISANCKGAFHADICPSCPLRPVCSAR